MGFDNVCKRLAEYFPHDFATWLLGHPVSEVEILKTELGNEPIHADSVLLLKLRDAILHLEFQTTLKSDPPLPLRMLDYWVRLHRKYGLPVTQFVIVLEETSAEIPTEFRAANTWHRYEVVKLWERDAEIPEALLGILPLVPLMRTSHPKRLLSQVADRLQQIEPLSLRSDLIACTNVLAGLRFDLTLVNTLLTEEVMENSVTYQYIIQKGELRGELRGELKGELKGRFKTIIGQLTHRFGKLSVATQNRIAGLETSRLDALSEALLDFKSKVELNDWLKRNG